MPPTNSKNMPLSAAVTDLGLGDQLNQQRDDETEEMKKRRALLEQMRQAVNPMGAPYALGLQR